MDNMPIRGGGQTPTRRPESRPVPEEERPRVSTEPIRHVTHASRNGEQKGKKKRLLWGVVIVVALVITLVISGAAYMMLNKNIGIDGSKFQAVFFTNGQVYFGKLQEQNSQYLKLTNIYYLQTKSVADSKNPQQTTDQQSSDVQLVKLGSEVHGPTDEMLISRQQVLFFENLKDEGKVAQTIKSYQDTKK